jgi:hypothetical protein
MDTPIFVKVQSDFTVRPGSKPVPVPFERSPDALKVIKLAVDDNSKLLVFVGDGLVAAGQVNDAQARMAKPDALVSREPVVLTIRPPMAQPLSGAVQQLFWKRPFAREESSDTTHIFGSVRLSISV